MSNIANAPSPPLLRQELAQRLFFLLVALGAILFAYHHVLSGMIKDWYLDENSSHGFIVPVVTAYLIWKRRSVLIDLPIKPNVWGLFLLLAGIGLLLLGWVATEYFTMRFSLIVVLCGCITYCFGWPVLSAIAGPMAYLILMIPIPAILYDAAAFPLKLFVTQVSVSFMKAIGIMVVRDGNVMAFPNITLEVVNACSGLRSLTSLLAVGLAYVMLVVKVRWQKAVLIALIFPIALAANMVRVIGTGILAQYYGAAAAEGFFHEFAGLVIFMASIIMLTVAHGILSRVSR